MTDLVERLRSGNVTIVSKSVHVVDRSILTEASVEIERLRERLAFAKAILEICAAGFSTEPGTVQSCAVEINQEFQRRMEAAGRALTALTETPDARASGSNPVSKDASMEGRGVDPTLRGATSPTLSNDETADERIRRVARDDSHFSP